MSRSLLISKQPKHLVENTISQPFHLDKQNTKYDGWWNMD